MIIAVDIGATKTLVARFTERGDIVGHQHRFSTPHDPHQFISQLIGIIQELWDSEVKVIVVGAPGTIDYKTNIVQRFGNLPWTEFDIAKALNNNFHTPVLIDNDANIAGLGEAHQLSPIPSTVLYVTLSTGIKAGIVGGGKIDPTVARGESGHMVLEYDGQLKTWEDLASGRAIKRDYGKLAKDISDPEAWQEITHRIACGFLVLLPVIQPDIVIIGGGVGSHFNRFGSLLRDELESKLPAMINLPPIQQAKYPEEAVLYGCYELAQQHLAAHRA